MFVPEAKSVLGAGVDLLGNSDRGLLILAETWDLVILAYNFGGVPPWLNLDSAGLHGTGRGADRDGKTGVLAQDGLVGDDRGHGDV